MKEKLLIIGIDGATFDIIRPLVQAGELPHFGRVLREGVSSDMESTFPPVTGPAWVSFMTGVNPGKHGMFGFFGYTSQGYERPFTSYKDIKVDTIWKILSNSGKRVCLINVPMTYPADELNGFVIPGYQYGVSAKYGFTFPRELFREIQENVGDYKPEHSGESIIHTEDRDPYIKGWSDLIEMRKRTALYLMKKYEWDAFMVVFRATDEIQHHFWKYFDQQHPFHQLSDSKRYGTVIPDCYKKVDAAVGEILDSIDDDTYVIFVSDHGAGPLHKHFYLNRWLIDNGFLSLKFKDYPLVRFKWPHIVYKILRRIGYRGIAWTTSYSAGRDVMKKIDPREGLRISHLIDWSKTKAYAGGHTEQGIYINLKGREQNGIVERGKEYESLRDELIKRLYELRDPDTNEKVIDKVHKKEEVYNGPYIDNAPDIFFIIKAGRYEASEAIHPRVYFETAKKVSGTHRMNGILIMKGNGIKKGHILKEANITDIAPTILYLTGTPIPDYVDGKVIQDAFDNDYLAKEKICYVHHSDIGKDSGHEDVYSEEEKEEIMQKLRGVGYI